MAPTAFPPATSASQIYFSIRLPVELTKFSWREKPLWSRKVEYWESIQQNKIKTKSTAYREWFLVGGWWFSSVSQDELYSMLHFCQSRKSKMVVLQVICSCNLFPAFCFNIFEL